MIAHIWIAISPRRTGARMELYFPLGSHASSMIDRFQGSFVQWDELFDYDDMGNVASYSGDGPDFVRFYEHLLATFGPRHRNAYVLMYIDAVRCVAVRCLRVSAGEDLAEAVERQCLELLGDP